MTDIVVIALSRFAPPAKKIAGLLNADIRWYRKGVFEEVFCEYSAIIAVMSFGIVIRSCASLLRDKWLDPAVIGVTPDLSFVVALSGGHHGANELACHLADLTGSTPVLSTATEVLGRPSVEGIARNHALRIANRQSTRAVNAGFLDGDVPVIQVIGPAVVLAQQGVSFLAPNGKFVVGLGCRKGIHPDEVLSAIRLAVVESGIDKNEIFVYATTDKKSSESGLMQAIQQIGGILVFVDENTMNAQMAPSPSRAELIGLKGVAEPAALALSLKKDLIFEKKVYGGVTIAIAR